MYAGNVVGDYLMPDRFLPGYRKGIPSRLLHCLDSKSVRYQVQHEPDGPEQIRRSSHRIGLVHTAVVRVGKGRAVAVLSGGRDMDLKKFTRLTGEPVRLETEDEFKWLFPDCTLGAIPPFGNLYGLPTWVDKCVAENEQIPFFAGTLIASIRLPYSAYEEMVRPNVGEFSR
jgi:Ala-tRNA(Pro) deacylase